MEEKEEQGRQTPAVPTGHTSETAAEGYSFFPASGTFWAPSTSSHPAVPDSRIGRICPFREGLILLPAFPLPEDSKNLKQSLSTPPEQQGHGPGSWSQRCPPRETGRVAEDPKGQKVVNLGLSCRSGLSMANTSGVPRPWGEENPRRLSAEEHHVYTPALQKHQMRTTSLLMVLLASPHRPYSH